MAGLPNRKRPELRIETRLARLPEAMVGGFDVLHGSPVQSNTGHRHFSRSGSGPAKADGGRPCIEEAPRELNASSKSVQTVGLPVIPGKDPARINPSAAAADQSPETEASCQSFTLTCDGLGQARALQTPTALHNRLRAEAFPNKWRSIASRR